MYLNILKRFGMKGTNKLEVPLRKIHICSAKVKRPKWGEAKLMLSLENHCICCKHLPVHLLQLLNSGKSRPGDRSEDVNSSFLFLMFSSLCTVSLSSKLPLFSLFWSLSLMSVAFFKCLRPLVAGLYLKGGHKKQIGSTGCVMGIVDCGLHCKGKWLSCFAGELPISGPLGLSPWAGLSSQRGILQSSSWR